MRTFFKAGFDPWGGLFSWRGGEKGPSLRRCWVGIGPALRGWDVGKFPGRCSVGTGGWFLRVCAMLHEGFVDCARREVRFE